MGNRARRQRRALDSRYFIWIDSKRGKVDWPSGQKDLKDTQSKAQKRKDSYGRRKEPPKERTTSQFFSPHEYRIDRGATCSGSYLFRVLVIQEICYIPLERDSSCPGEWEQIGRSATTNATSGSQQECCERRATASWGVTLGCRLQRLPCAIHDTLVQRGGACTHQRRDRVRPKRTATDRTAKQNRAGARGARAKVSGQRLLRKGRGWGPIRPNRGWERWRFVPGAGCGGGLVGLTATGTCVVAVVWTKSLPWGQSSRLSVTWPNLAGSGGLRLHIFHHPWVPSRPCVPSVVRRGGHYYWLTFRGGYGACARGRLWKRLRHKVTEESGPRLVFSL